ncbi:PREDICTED: protein prenyltransferase alpha subunit repeat-containing protein 1 [Nanorana parkeri]|uniref:protein prenyltransferase alpha subunit repeat-containing protein 1 n=1 Tax=Nanorana parkeri TaxID=125878 RepID=UPI000853FC2F|nr:PREDICTED: protein prenyltransferase alpha subunit repeat-containing protein 1 [Nanorana parkeri]
MAEWKEEVEVLVQRVVKDITGAFRRNPNIDEIGLIPCPEAKYNRSPIVLVDNKLGVESWCIKFLLPYVYNKLLLYRQKKLWLNRDELIDVTCTLLLLNPDFATAWNVRKELILSGVLNPVKDLQLGKLALTKFPKSPETWIHRRWVLLRFLQEHISPSIASKEGASHTLTEQVQGIIQEEMNVCCEAAGRYPSNYNCWSHRIWVLQHLGKLNIKLLIDELSSTKHWVSVHVSDHSGFHYRQFLLKSLLAKAQTDSDNSAVPESPCPTIEEEGQQLDVPLLIEEEMELSRDLIESYPGHEALWCHRRQILGLIHQLHNEQSPSSTGQVTDVDDAVIGPGSGSHNYTSFPGYPINTMDIDGACDKIKQGFTQETKRLKRTPVQDSLIFESELRFISCVLTGCRNAEQCRFAASYRKWLLSILDH